MDQDVKNKRWAGNWGHTFDPKSSPLVYVSKEEFERNKELQKMIIVGPGTSGAVKESWRSYRQFREALLNGTLDNLPSDEELDAKANAAREAEKQAVVVTKQQEVTIQIDDPSYEDGEDSIPSNCPIIIGANIKCEFTRVWSDEKQRLVCLDPNCPSNAKVETFEDRLAREAAEDSELFNQ